MACVVSLFTVVTPRLPRYRTRNRTRECDGRDLGSTIDSLFDSLPPDLERLRILRVWHAMWLARIDRKIELLLKRQAEQDHGRRTKPKPPEWVVELGIGVGRPPTQVHRGSCYMAGKRRRPVEWDEVRRSVSSPTAPAPALAAGRTRIAASSA
ncbi:DUF6233 domain-containing protein [Streptomyces sp. SID1328]|uniref:DUF6233 domain-containing protein n=1 Tax=Streptomyces sp. SID1328 TaxID=2690250 RepID=UPI0031F81AE9